MCGERYWLLAVGFSRKRTVQAAKRPKQPAAHSPKPIARG
jgi:hypothetical protein